jgi:hypothetical protein
MKVHKQISLLMDLNITGSAGLLIWWFLFPVILPIGDATENFQNLILDNNWTWLNLVGLVASLLLCLGLPGIYLAHLGDFSKSGFAGILLSCGGLILFTAIQYYETLIWPAAAQTNPELLQTNGPLISGNPGVLAGLLASGIILGIGYILFGMAALRTKKYNKTAILLLMTGAVVFGNGIVFPVRTIGLLLFCSGTIWLSLLIKKAQPGERNLQ